MSGTASHHTIATPGAFGFAEGGLLPQGAAANATTAFPQQAGSMPPAMDSDLAAGHGRIGDVSGWVDDSADSAGQIPHGTRTQQLDRGAGTKAGPIYTPGSSPGSLGAVASDDEDPQRDTQWGAQQWPATGERPTAGLDALPMHTRPGPPAHRHA